MAGARNAWNFVTCEGSTGMWSFLLQSSDKTRANTGTNLRLRSSFGFISSAMIAKSVRGRVGVWENGIMGSGKEIGGECSFSNSNEKQNTRVSCLFLHH